MCLNTNIFMQYGGESLPQGKPNFSFEGVTYPYIIIEQVKGMENLPGIFQITISRLPDKANKIYINYMLI